MLPITDEFPEASRWKKLAKIIRFESERTITSRKSLTAKQALASVRGHWEIENKLHWTLDVAFREDDSRLPGIKNRRLEADWNDNFLMKVLASHAD